MLPESIKAEIDAKGGLAGPPEPQGNGTTIYRAVSGDYVVVHDASGLPRMRGFSPPAEGAIQQQAPAQPAATAPAPAPGAGGMNQQQLEELLRQVAPNNDPRRLVFSEGVRKKTKPADVFGPGGETQTKWVKWVDPGTGRIVEADIEEDGSYTVTKNAIERSEQGSAATSATDTTPKPRQSRVNPADPTKTQEFNPDTGKWEDVGPNQVEIDRRKKEADAEAEKNRPKPEKAPDGTYGYWDTKQAPPKWVPISNAPTAARTPVEINGQWGVWEPGADGVPVFKPVNAPAKPQIPSNVPPFVPDWSKPGLGIVEYANAIRARPDLTDDQKKEVITAAHGNATATVSQANSLVTAQADEANRRTTERGQDTAQANQRLSTSSTNFGNALEAAQAGTKYSTGPDAAAVLPYYLAQAAGQAAAYGGFNTPPAVQPGPAIGQVNRMGIPGLPDVLGNNGPWGSGGNVVNPINPNGPGQPNVAPAPAPLLGPPPAVAGSVAPASAAPAVSAPAIAAPAPAVPVMGAPTAGEPGGPPLAPGPVWEPPAPLPIGQNPDAGQALGPTGNSGPLLTTAAPSPPPATGNPAGFAGQTVFPVMEPGDTSGLPAEMGPTHLPTPENVAPEPEVTYRNRMTGETVRMTRSRREEQRNWVNGMLWEEVPDEPVQMAPTGGPSVASMIGAGPWQQQAAPEPTGMAQMVAMQGQQALMGYDPRAVNQEALNDGFDADVVALFGGGLG